VSRLKAPFTQFPGNVAIGQGQQPTDRAKEFGQVTAKEMRLVGLNMDMAPVMDVRRGTVEKHLRGRTFSDDPRLVAELGVAVIKALQSNGIIAVAKHFPGLGRARLDPHLELPTITASRKEMDQVNLPPFGAAIGARVSAIMTSHAIYTDLDPDKPATLSKEIITDLLRKKMGYEGIVITDDLEMGAIRKNWGVAESAVKSFAAGCDILLICQDQENVRKGLMAFERELDCGGIPEERLTESLGRITRLKSGFLRPLQPISIDAVREYFPDPMPITV
jgi:beta-N-acetylhexosaminidase